MDSDRYAQASPQGWVIRNGQASRVRQRNTGRVGKLGHVLGMGIDG